MQHVGPPYSQGAVPSHHNPQYSESLHQAVLRFFEKQPNGGSVTSSLRQWRKKEMGEKTGEGVPTPECVPRVPAQSYYPRPNSIAHFSPQFTDYSLPPPFKQPSPAAPVKYSEIVETQQSRGDVNPIMPTKSKEKEYMDLRPQYQDPFIGQSYPDPMKGGYGDPTLHPYMSKEQIAYLHKPHYQQSYPQQYLSSTYNMQSYGGYNGEVNKFLANLNKINPHMAQSILNDRHLRESQLALEGARGFPSQQQRIYPGQARQQYYPYNFKSPDVPTQFPYYQNKYLPPEQHSYSPGAENLHLNFSSPKYPQNNQLEYAQHYQHRKVDYYGQQYKNYQQTSAQEVNRARKSSLKQFLENWVDEDLSGNLPDLVVSNNLNEDANFTKSTTKTEGSERTPEQPLYILDTTEIPSENLPNYLHLQQIEKLPDNIRGYYAEGNKRVIVDNPNKVPAERNADNQIKILENKVVQIHILDQPDEAPTEEIKSMPIITEEAKKPEGLDYSKSHLENLIPSVIRTTNSEMLQLKTPKPIQDFEEHLPANTIVKDVTNILEAACEKIAHYKEATSFGSPIPKDDGQNDDDDDDATVKSEQSSSLTPPPLSPLEDSDHIFDYTVNRKEKDLPVLSSEDQVLDFRTGIMKMATDTETSSTVENPIAEIKDEETNQDIAPTIDFDTNEFVLNPEVNSEPTENLLKTEEVKDEEEVQNKETPNCTDSQTSDHTNDNVKAEPETNVTKEIQTSTTDSPVDLMMEQSAPIDYREDPIVDPSTPNPSTPNDPIPDPVTDPITDQPPDDSPTKENMPNLENDPIPELTSNDSEVNEPEFHDNPPVLSLPSPIITNEDLIDDSQLIQTKEKHKKRLRGRRSASKTKNRHRTIKEKVPNQSCESATTKIKLKLDRNGKSDGEPIYKIETEGTMKAKLRPKSKLYYDDSWDEFGLDLFQDYVSPPKLSRISDIDTDMERESCEVNDKRKKKVDNEDGKPKKRKYRKRVRFEDEIDAESKSAKIPKRDPIRKSKSVRKNLKVKILNVIENDKRSNEEQPTPKRHKNHDPKSPQSKEVIMHDSLSDDNDLNSLQTLTFNDQQESDKEPISENAKIDNSSNSLQKDKEDSHKLTIHAKQKRDKLTIHDNPKVDNDSKSLQKDKPTDQLTSHDKPDSDKETIHDNPKVDNDSKSLQKDNETLTIHHKKKSNKLTFNDNPKVHKNSNSLQKNKAETDRLTIHDKPEPDKLTFNDSSKVNSDSNLLQTIDDKQKNDQDLSTPTIHDNPKADNDSDSLSTQEAQKDDNAEKKLGDPFTEKGETDNDLLKSPQRELDVTIPDNEGIDQSSTTMNPEVQPTLNEDVQEPSAIPTPIETPLETTFTPEEQQVVNDTVSSKNRSEATIAPNEETECDDNNNDPKTDTSEDAGDEINASIVYQIADNNVLLQIADELLEINVSMQDGKKVIMVKTLGDSVVINDQEEAQAEIVDDNDKENVTVDPIAENPEIPEERTKETAVETCEETREETESIDTKVDEAKEKQMEESTEKQMEEIKEKQTEPNKEEQIEETKESNVKQTEETIPEALNEETVVSNEEIVSSSTEPRRKETLPIEAPKIEPVTPKTKGALKFIEEDATVPLESKKQDVPPVELTTDKPVITRPKTRCKVKNSLKPKLTMEVVKRRKIITEKSKELDIGSIHAKIELDLEEFVEKKEEVQENNVTSSTSSQEAEYKNADWENESDESKLSQKRRLSLQEYKKKRNTNAEKKPSPIPDLTSDLVIAIKPQVRCESPKIARTNFGTKETVISPDRFDITPETPSPPLSNRIELQLPKPKPQNFFKNQLNNLNFDSLTASLIKEHQYLMQRFLTQEKLTPEELGKVKQIIRYKKMIQKSNGEHPAFIQSKLIGCIKKCVERKRKRRFRNLYSEEDGTDEDVSKKDEEGNDYSVRQSDSLTLVFKKSIRHDMQPFVRLERLPRLDQLARRKK